MSQIKVWGLIKMKKFTNKLTDEITLNKLARLLLTAILTFYIVQIGYFLINGQVCDDYGFDYCAYWSIGKIIRTEGISNIYNLDLITNLENEIYPQASIPSINFTPPYAPYVPLFMIPFAFLSFLNLPTSYLLWTGINLIGFIIYLKFFIKEIIRDNKSSNYLFLIFLTLPLFITFQEGQLNILLAVSAGEFIRSIINDKPFKAGLWLGGWLLKPQILILILPFLLIQRLYESLAGFTTSAAMILGLSFFLIGYESVLEMVEIFLNLGGGGLGSNPYVMMNWRMLGTHIGSITSSTIGYIMIILGTLITGCVPLFVFKKRMTPDSTSFVTAILGVFAATCAITWHAHLHMSIILIPPIIYLQLKGQFNKRLFLSWVLVPPLALFVGYLIVILIQLANLPVHTNQTIFFAKGFSIFIFNLLFTGWSITHYQQMTDNS